MERCAEYQWKETTPRYLLRAAGDPNLSLL